MVASGEVVQEKVELRELVESWLIENEDWGVLEVGRGDAEAPSLNFST